MEPAMIPLSPLRARIAPLRVTHRSAPPTASVSA